MFMDNDGMTLASEILKEVKASARRWFIAFLCMLGIECLTVGGFLWYLSLPTDEISIENDEGNANYIGGNVGGGVYNNGENNDQETGNETETEEALTNGG